MAFVNEFVPDEEWQKEISLYGWSSTVKIGSQWTIDKEKNVKLFRFLTRVDFPDEKYFAFLWKSYGLKVLLKESWCDNTITWSLKTLALPRELEDKREEILQDLRDAMKVFGCFCRVIPRSNPSLEASVIIKF